MTTGLVRTLNPIEAELQRRNSELAALDAELAQRELELLTFRTELFAFQTRYLKAVGPLYAELDQIEAELAELRAEQSPTNQKAQQRARAAREQADQSKQANEATQNEDEPKFKPTDSLKKLYREFAKRFHPDLATDDAERSRLEKLMADANQAYAAGDEIRLQELMDTGSITDTSDHDDLEAQLQRVFKRIRQLKERLQNIQIDLAELKGSSVFQLKKQVEEAAERGLDLIQEMVNFLHREIAKAWRRKSKINPTT